MKPYELTFQEMANCQNDKQFESILRAERAAQKKLLEYIVTIACPSTVNHWDRWWELLEDFGL